MKATPFLAMKKHLRLWNSQAYKKEWRTLVQSFLLIFKQLQWPRNQGLHWQHFILFITYEWIEEAGVLHFTRLESLVRNKHSSLLGSCTSYKDNEVLRIRFLLKKRTLALGLKIWLSFRAETGQNLGRVFDSRTGCVYAMQLPCFEAKKPNLMLKTWAK